MCILCASSCIDTVSDLNLSFIFLCVYFLIFNFFDTYEIIDISISVSGM